MIPTTNLRFVDRNTGKWEQYDVKVTERHGTEVCYRQKVIRTLQQWWQDIDPSQGEWRDVPLEKE